MKKLWNSPEVFAAVLTVLGTLVGSNITNPLVAILAAGR